MANRTPLVMGADGLPQQHQAADTASFPGPLTAASVAIGTVAAYLFEVLQAAAGTVAKLRKGVAGGDVLVLDAVNSLTPTNWLKFTTSNEQYAYGAVYTAPYALVLGSQFNLQLSPGSVGGSASASVVVGYNDFNQSPSYKFGVIAGSTGQVGANILGRSGQTANLQQWGLYSSGDGISGGITYTVTASIGPDGSAKFLGLTLANAPTYASDSAAGSGGLTTGQVYKTSDGAGGFTLKIKS